LRQVKTKKPSRLLVSLIITSILILSVAGSSIPLSNALIQADHTYLNDNPITTSTGNTKVCGDHLCAPGEWEKLQDARSTAQQEHNTVNATQLGTKHAVPSGTIGDPQTISLDQISRPVPGTPYPIPSPIPTPNPGPSSSLRPSPNQSSTYVKTDKQYYVIGVQQETIVHIYGQIPNLQNSMVTVYVKTPYNVYNVMTTYTGSLGSFSLPYIIGFDSPAGQYDITVDYSGGQVFGSFFVTRS
jgi:hypothetical protein